MKWTPNSACKFTRKSGRGRRRRRSKTRHVCCKHWSMFGVNIISIERSVPNRNGSRRLFRTLFGIGRMKALTSAWWFCKKIRSTTTGKNEGLHCTLRYYEANEQTQTYERTKDRTNKQSTSGTSNQAIHQSVPLQILFGKDHKAGSSTRHSQLVRSCRWQIRKLLSSTRYPT